MNRTGVVWVAGLCVVVLTARLGWWQLERAAQKTALQTSMALSQQAAVSDPAAFFSAQLQAGAATPAALHRPVSLSGRWLPDHTVFLDNRQMNARPGFFVLTPLLLDGVRHPNGQGVAIVVQRGWVPRDFLQRDRISPVPTPSTGVRVQARLAGPPARLLEMSTNPSTPKAAGVSSTGAGAIAQNLDMAQLQSELGAKGMQVLPQLTLVQTDPPGPDGLLRQWAQPQSGVAKHHGYAVQWFALSALTVVLLVWFQVIAPRRKKNAASSTLHTA